MGAITIKSPNSDIIWDTWKQKNVKKQNLEKHYKVKGSIFNLENITAAEYVKGVDKAAIIFMLKKNTIKPDSEKPTQKIIPIKKLTKETFFEFKTSPKKEDWKEDSMVPFINTLTPISCEKCKGSGKVICNKCNGNHLVACPTCGDGKGLKCKECNGSGKITSKIVVINEKGDKTKKEISLNCNECYGNGKISCSKCGDSGKIPCQYCNAQGMFKCTECDGYGVKYRYEIRPVPFKQEQSNEPLLFSSIKLSGLEKQIGQDIQETIDEVEGILITKPDHQLDKKFVEPSLGYMSKDIQKMLKNCKKEIGNTEKDSSARIILPVYLFPVFVLNCETKKGKKFQVFAIGSEKKFHVYGEI